MPKSNEYLVIMNRIICKSRFETWCLRAVVSATMSFEYW